MSTSLSNEELIEMINMCESKNDLEELMKAEKGVNLNKQFGLTNLKEQSVTIVNGGDSKSESTESEQGESKEDELSANEAQQEVEPVAPDNSGGGLQTEMAAIANLESKPEEVTPEPVAAVKVGRDEKFLRKKSDKRVYSWNSQLAKRSDMYLCNVDGKLLSAE